MQARIRFAHDMTFIGTGESGHVAVMDTTEASGGNDSAPTPKEMLLFALGGCTGMDVVSILRKMRIEPHSVEVVVTGEVQPEAPRAFTTFHLEYRFEGEGLPLPSLERAVVLSQEKYCSVSMTLIPNHVITWAISVNGQIVKTSMEPRTEKV